MKTQCWPIVVWFQCCLLYFTMKYISFISKVNEVSLFAVKKRGFATEEVHNFQSCNNQKMGICTSSTSSGVLLSHTVQFLKRNLSSSTVEICTIQWRGPIRPKMVNRATQNLVPIAPLGPDGLAPKPCHLRRHVG